MKIELVTSLREFDALASIWRDVTKDGGQNSPFLSHDWFACCWRTAGPNRRREVWLLEDSAGPVALIPLVRWKTRIRGVPVRMVGFLDSPDTPFADFPVAGALDEAIGAFLALLQSRRDWDVLSLPKLPAHSRTYKALEAAFAGQLRWRVAGRQYSPHLAISERWEEFFGHKPPRFREACRDIENRLQQSGAVTVEEHREVDPRSPIFAEVLEVSGRSWRGLRGPTRATREAMPRFYHELTQRASANGWLHLWILRLDGRAVATEYQIGANGHLHALRADFESALPDLSPGACLNLEIVRSLFERGGVHEYNMGPGLNDDKLRWATGTHELRDLQIYAPTLCGRLLYGIETRLVPLARQVRAQVIGQ